MTAGVGSVPVSALTCISANPSARPRCQSPLRCSLGAIKQVPMSYRVREGMRLWTDMVRRWCARSVTLIYLRHHWNVSIVCRVDTSAVRPVFSARRAGTKPRAKHIGLTGIVFRNSAHRAIGEMCLAGYRDGNQHRAGEEVTQHRPRSCVWEQRKEAFNLVERPANRPTVVAGQMLSQRGMTILFGRALLHTHRIVHNA